MLLTDPFPVIGGVVGGFRYENDRCDRIFFFLHHRELYFWCLVDQLRILGMIIKMNSVDCLIGLVLLQLIILLGWFYFIAIFGLFLFVMF